MKGITAINALIIIVIGVIVLLAVLALFMGVWTSAGSGTALEVATDTACRIINPTYCNPQGFTDCQRAERVPIYDFDADNDGVANEHTQDVTFPTSWQSSPGNYEDNFGSLCYEYYGGPRGISGNELLWYQRCLLKVCDCPQYAGATC